MKWALLFSLLVIAAPSVTHAREWPTGFQTVETAKIYRGGRPTPEHLRKLKAKGIRTIIGLQGGDTESRSPFDFILKAVSPGERMNRIARERDQAEELGLQFIWEPLSAIIFYTGKITRKEDPIVDDALRALNTPALYPIYIHCTRGADRTGLIIALWRVQHGRSIAKAHREWVRSGHRGLTGLVTHTLDKYFYAKAKTLQRPTVKTAI